MGELFRTSLQQCTRLPQNMSVIETFQRYKLQLGQWWFAAKRSGTSATFPQWYIVIYKPGKIEEKKQTVPKPKIQNQCFWVPMVHIFPVSKLQFSPAASFVCGVWKRMKAFFFPWSRSAAWRNGLCGTVACRLRTGLSHLPISPSPSSKPVVVRPLICCNLPLQPQCQDRSYFRSSSRLSSVAKQDFKET